MKSNATITDYVIYYKPLDVYIRFKEKNGNIDLNYLAYVKTPREASGFNVIECASKIVEILADGNIEFIENNYEIEERKVKIGSFHSLGLKR